MRPPIAPPEATPAIRRMGPFDTPETQVFWCRVWPFLGLAFVICHFLFVPVFWYMASMLNDPLPFIFAMGLFLEMSVVALGLGGPKDWKVRLNSHGIEGRNIWGIPQVAEWSEIQVGKPFRLLWLPFLRLESSHRYLRLWLPLFLRDMTGFFAAVYEFAPPENPLRRYFEEHPPR